MSDIALAGSEKEAPCRVKREMGGNRSKQYEQSTSSLSGSNNESGAQ